MIVRWSAILTLLFLCATPDVQDDPPITCPIPVVTNGVVIDHNSENLSVGKKLTVKCGSDYELSRDETVQSVCTADG